MITKKIFNRFYYFIFTIFLISHSIIFKIYSDNLDNELESLFGSLNNLSPEDQDILNKLNEELNNMERQMKEKGLDPNNINDLMKWFENPSIDNNNQNNEELEKINNKPFESPTNNRENLAINNNKLETKKTAIVNDVKSTKKMVEDIINNLSLIRQKVAHDKKINKKLSNILDDLNKLIYYLNILTEPNLIKYLSSSEFLQLYSKLKNLDNKLSQYSNIIYKSLEEDEMPENPYKVLEIPNFSGLETIENAYNNLKIKYSPEKIKETIKEKSLKALPEDEKMLSEEEKLLLEDASLIFSFIEDAYNILKDKKLKNAIDRELKEKQEFSFADKLLIEDSFNDIINTLNKAILNDKIISDIENMLNKYKTEESSIAKEQQELEKNVIERYKQPRKINIKNIPLNEFGIKNFDQFYNQLRNEHYYRMFQNQQYGYNRTRPGNNNIRRNQPHYNKPTNANTNKIEKKTPIKKEEAKNNKITPSKNITKKPDIDLAKEKNNIYSDFNISLLFSQTLDILTNVANDKNYNKIIVDKKKLLTYKFKDDKKKDSTKKENKNKKFIELSLDKIANDLEDYLFREPIIIKKTEDITKEEEKEALNKDKDTIKEIKLFNKEKKIDDLVQIFSKIYNELSDKNKEIKSEDTIKKWNDISKYYNKINNWYKTFYDAIHKPYKENSKGIKEHRDIKKIYWHNINKLELESLDKELEEKEKDMESTSNLNLVEFDISKFLNNLKNIVDYMNKINQKVNEYNNKIIELKKIEEKKKKEDELKKLEDEKKKSKKEEDVNDLKKKLEALEKKLSEDKDKK